MDKGVYCLVLKNKASIVKTGALGEIPYRDGWHVYVGSALGPGGLLRVARHIRCTRGMLKKPRWHIDYLLTHPSFELTHAVCAHTGDDFECRIAKRLAGDPVRGFGSSDCSCVSHLFFFKNYPLDNVISCIEDAGLYAIITTLKNS
jgi:Uri superfamily endonuclease